MDDKRDNQEPAAKRVKLTSFKSLNISNCLISALNQISISTPTEIQLNIIPKSIDGHNVIASAKTGQGKTLAFALPILQKLSQDPFGIFALILTPARELAFQIAEQFRVLGSSLNLKQTVVVGGVDMMTQALSLSNRPHIVVATPGRLIDHIRSNKDAIDLSRLKFLVLDEADRLLGESFADDLTAILQSLPDSRQTLLFTATMPSEIQDLRFSNKDPFIYKGNTRYDTIDKLDQRY